MYAVQNFRHDNAIRLLRATATTTLRLWREVCEWLAGRTMQAEIAQAVADLKGASGPLNLASSDGWD